MDFKESLFNFITYSLTNYHSDNYDVERFGKQKRNFIRHIKKRILSSFLTNYVEKYIFTQTMAITHQILESYGNKLNQLYHILENDKSRNWLIALVAYRILGHEKVKLPTNTPAYFSSRKKVKQYLQHDQFVEVNFLGKNKKLFLANLEKLGMDIMVYSAGVDHIFILEQHKYKDIVTPEKGDIVLDCGACYGDSALYFAHHAGKDGQVFSFEFIRSNLDVFQKNMELNPAYQEIIQLIEYPLWDKSGEMVFYKDHGPGSIIKFNQFEGYHGSVQTLTIDDFYNEQKLNKVDYIKMDVEGAEQKVLKGAEQVIKRHKPKLAIASYHSLDDFVNIPLWIHGLDLGYKIYLDHSTIHWEETVVFARAD